MNTKNRSESYKCCDYDEEKGQTVIVDFHFHGADVTSENFQSVKSTLNNIIECCQSKLKDLDDI